MANDFSFQIVEFPSPLEVYRFISRVDDLTKYVIPRFPSPLEVYRFISKRNTRTNQRSLSFRPLSRYIGLYHSLSEMAVVRTLIVSVPSRGI